MNNLLPPYLNKAMFIVCISFISFPLLANSPRGPVELTSFQKECLAQFPELKPKKGERPDRRKIEEALKTCESEPKEQTETETEAEVVIEKDGDCMCDQSGTDQLASLAELTKKLESKIDKVAQRDRKERADEDRDRTDSKNRRSKKKSREEKAEERDLEYEVYSRGYYAETNSSGGIGRSNYSEINPQNPYAYELLASKMNSQSANMMPSFMAQSAGMGSMMGMSGMGGMGSMMGMSGMGGMGSMLGMSGMGGMGSMMGMSGMGGMGSMMGMSGMGTMYPMSSYGTSMSMTPNYYGMGNSSAGFGISGGATLGFGLIGY